MKGRKRRKKSNRPSQGRKLTSSEEIDDKLLQWLLEARDLQVAVSSARHGEAEGLAERLGGEVFKVCCSYKHLKSQGTLRSCPQLTSKYLDKLPTKVSALPILHFTRKHFQVRRAKVLDVLLWLKANNRFYHDIQINFDNISAPPFDGVNTEVVVEESNHPAKTVTD